MMPESNENAGVVSAGASKARRNELPLDDNPIRATSQPLTAARSYAGRGWRVFPCHTVRDGTCACGAADCGSPGKHPLTEHGLKDAISDKAIVFNWWQQRPDANIAGATGPAFGLALDVDAGKGGDESLRDLQREHGELPPTPTSHTGGGGLHLIFAYPELAAGEIVKNKVGIAPGVDVRAEGGYIILPPSLHISGRRYVWDAENGPDTPMAPLPDWLRAMVVTRNDNGHRPAEPIGDTIPEGQRNATLASLAGSMRRRGMSEGAIHAALAVENETRCDPIPDTEIDTIAHSVAKYPPAPEYLHVVPAAPATEAPHLTDMGNSARWCRQHGDDAHFCDGLGGWLLWNGSRWQLDECGAVMEMAKRTAISIYGEAEAAPTLEGRKAISKWAATSEAASRLSAMLELSRSALPAAVSDFDRDPFLLNVLNGTIDIHTGDIREPSRGDMITKMAPVHYQADATDPVFDAFMAVVTDGDEELTGWLQRGFGYSLTGDMTEEFMAMIIGPTLTGKSTLLHAVADTLGDYGYKASIDTFLEHRDAGAARPDLTALRGTRFVIATEAPKGKRLDEPLVKAIVGGDSLTARTLFHPPFTFYPQCKLWFGSNFAPVMNNLDGAIWRRVRRIPFEASFAGHVDPQIKPYLCNNPDARAAILAWAVKGCLAWQREGMGKAGVVERKTEELRREMNPLTEYLDAKCVVGPAYSVDAGALRRDYTTWSRDTGSRPVSNKDWGEQLLELGCKEERPRIGGKQRRVWRGIGLAISSRLSQEEGEKTATQIQMKDCVTDVTDERADPVTLS